MRIEGLRKYRGRPSIDDLPAPMRSEASNCYSSFLRSINEQGKFTPQTTRAILVGQAKRMAHTTPEERSRWGRALLAKLGGLRVQQLYRETGRVGDAHPSRIASRVSAARRRSRKEEKLREA